MSTVRHSGKQQPLTRRLAHIGFVGETLGRDLRAHVLSAPPNQRLQSERVLAQTYGISHSTVRRVVETLTNEGLLYKTHGKGVFVATRAQAAAAKTILYIDDWADMKHAFCLGKLRGVLEGESHGFRVQVHKSHPSASPPQEALLLQEAARPDVAGMIVSWLTPEQCERFRERNPALAIVTTHCELPLANTASVLYDWHAYGREAAGYLAGKGARTLLLVYGRKAFAQGARQALQGDIRLLEVKRNSPLNAEKICEAVLGTTPEGLAVDDDRAFMQLLPLLEQRRPDFLKTTKIVSIANAGEQVLPPQVARLEVDGYQVGLLAFNALKALLDGKAGGRVVIRIKVVLKEPLGC
jgi:DNA-binding LacI/PurR family transcriptional regulator